MDRQWVEIPDVAEQLNIPDRTLRRYLDRHARFLESKRLGRRHLVAERCIPLLTRIRDLYNTGKTAEQVDADLTASQLPVTIDVPGQPAPITMAGLISTMTTEMNSLRNEVATLRAALHTRDHLLEGRLEDLMQAGVTTLKETLASGGQTTTVEITGLRGEIATLRQSLSVRDERAEERLQLITAGVQAIRERGERPRWPGLARLAALFNRTPREDSTKAPRTS